MSTIDAAILYVVRIQIVLESLENLGKLGTLEEIQGVGFQTFIPVLLYSGFLISNFFCGGGCGFEIKNFVPRVGRLFERITMSLLMVGKKHSKKSY